jgi:hypothetical protein
MHTISAPAGPLAEWNIVVNDAQRRPGYASIRSVVLNADGYFVRGAGEPKLTMAAGRRVTVTWSNQRMTVPRPEAAGTAILFAKAAGCTTAQACVPEIVATGTDQPTAVNAQTENHSIVLTFPDRTRTYTVVLGGKAGSGNSTGEFFQVNVRTEDIQQ